VDAPSEAEESESCGMWNEVLEMGRDPISSTEACGPKDGGWSTSVGGSTMMGLGMVGAW
jgi:hypothetical protein